MLSSASGRRRLHKCLLEGEQVIEWALDAHLPLDHAFFHTDVRDSALLNKLDRMHVPCLCVSDAILKKISATSYLIPIIGVANLPHETNVLPRSANQFLLVLDGVKDHGNIGTIIRTASAFGIRHVWATRPDVDLHYRKTIEASRGTVFGIHLRRFTSPAETLMALKQQGYQVIATSPHASTLQAWTPLQPKPVALVVGNETSGVSDEMLDGADCVVRIPLAGSVESLNVGVATGISVYELKLKMVLAMLTTHIRSTLGREVNVAGKLIQRALDARLRQVSSLSGEQVILMMVLKCDQEMSLQQVSKDLAVFGDELDTLLGPLSDAGYIQHGQDSKQPTILLTERGEECLGKLWGILEAVEDEALSGFSPVEKDQLTDFLQRIQTNCIQMIDQSPT